jgi:DNA-directed RNA polymerase specialized sigma24 family protein
MICCAGRQRASWENDRRHQNGDRAVLETMTHVRASRTRTITPEAFARLLQRLDPDADRAAAEYQKLRLALEKFFDWRGSPSPDDGADETIDRLVAKLGGDEIIEDVRRFAYGIARLVLLEQRRQHARIPIAEGADLSQLSVAPPTDAADSLPACFDACLAQLPGDGRALVLTYYSGERQAKIDHRQGLARAAGISNTALRSRVHRLRDRLERCARRCAAAAETHGLNEALRHVTAIPDTLEQRHSDGD